MTNSSVTTFVHIGDEFAPEIHKGAHDKRVITLVEFDAHVSLSIAQMETLRNVLNVWYEQSVNGEDV